MMSIQKSKNDTLSKQKIHDTKSVFQEWTELMGEKKTMLKVGNSMIRSTQIGRSSKNM